MNRRKFITNGSAAGLVIGSLTGINLISGINEKQDQAGEKPLLPVSSFLLDEITIRELQEKMRSNELTSQAIVKLYLDRISAIDKKGPSLHAVIEINPDALNHAKQMDDERKTGKIRGPMHGIPVLIKDNIDTADKMMTTAGSLALEGNMAKEDAFIVKRLREAGAVILGKTNLSEWANFRSTRSVSGWSSRGGQTKNPCVLDRNPCGSSSGSAAAVAANLCTVAIGTETDGSVIAPSSMCGIVGIKPTVGLVSRSGIIPISKTQDTAGPMARTVSDAAILLTVLSGIDEADAVTKESMGKSKKDYTAFLDKNGLKGKKVGIEKSFLTGHEGVVSLFTKAIEVLKSEGAEIIEVELLDACRDLGSSEFLVMQYEFKDGLNKYLSASNAKVKSLAEVIAFNKKFESKTMPYFKQEILETCEKKFPPDNKEYTEALAKSKSAAQLIDDLMQRFQLDAFAGTSIGLPCCIDFINGDYDTGFYFCPPAAMAGYPHITVPMGKVHELPVGLSFIGGAYREDVIIKMAYAYEQASKKRESPKFLTTVS